VLNLRPGQAIRSIVCLGAHSDDIEIGAGATLVRLVQEHPGVRVTWVVMCSTPDRRAEAEASVRDLCAGAGSLDVRIHDLRDGFVPAEWARAKELVEAAAAAADADLVVTHTRHDLHQDHRTLAELAWNTWRDHLILECEVPKYDGDLRTPTLYVPLGEDHVARKIDVLMRHFGTQATKHWFTPETFRGLMRLRGIECRSPSGYAEGFHVRKIVL
jgi:LmbE family N-acetylglucosaminyl deacetylase